MEKELTIENLKHIVYEIVDNYAARLMESNHSRYKCDCGYNEYGSMGEAWDVEKAQDDAVDEIIGDLYSGDISAFNTAEFCDFLVKAVQSCR